MNDFEKIIGYENVKEELHQIVDMVKNFDVYEKLGARFPKGILIEGNPGLGKTMLAKALINECKVKTFIIKKEKTSREFNDVMTDIFNEAAKYEPSIILLDDLDKFERGLFDSSAFSVLQTCIDNIHDKKVLVVATANSLKDFPDSLLRPGRFDRHFHIEPPTQEISNKIIEYYLKQKKVDPSLNFDDINKMASYESCAYLETLINQSAILAGFNRKDFIGKDEIVTAYLNDQYNFVNNDLNCDAKKLNMLSIHEAGHAVIAEALKENCIGFISVTEKECRGRNGFTHWCKEFERRPELIVVTLGGKAASELLLEGRCASGCQGDLNYAYSLILGGITESGTNGFSLFKNNQYMSNEHKSNIENAVASELEKYMFIARDIIIKNKDLVLAISEQLKEKKYLFYSDIQKIKEKVKVVPHVL